MGPGHGTGRSSTALTAETSAAVPQTNIAYYILGAMPVRSAGEDMQRILDYVISDQSISTVILTAHWYGRGIPVTELEAELRAIQGSGKRVFITDDNPIFPFDPVQCGVRKAPIVPIGECAIAEASLAPAYDAFRAGLDQIVADVPGVELLLTHRMLCDGELCSMNRGTELLYRDPNHLNLNGTRYVAGRLLAEYPDLAAAMRP